MSIQQCHLSPESDSSFTWGYFEQEQGKVRCVLCRAALSNEDATAEELQKHLKENHPNLYQNSDNEGEDEREIDGDIFTEVIYLDERDENRCKKVKKMTPKPTKKEIEMSKSYSRKRPKIIRRKDSTSSDEVLVKTTPKKEDEEIEKFAKYITCLLKTVPKDISSKLQMEIVNLIMSTKLKISQEKPTFEAVPGPSYVLTIPSTSVNNKIDTEKVAVEPSIVTVPVTNANEIYRIENVREGEV